MSKIARAFALQLALDDLFVVFVVVVAREFNVLRLRFPSFVRELTALAELP
jgi:hypothetical protein